MSPRSRSRDLAPIPTFLCRLAVFCSRPYDGIPGLSQKLNEEGIILVERFNCWFLIFRIG